MSEAQTSVDTASKFSPVLPEERIVVLDVLRGFALLGILIMNMSWFKIPGSAWAIEPRLFPDFVDRAADFVMAFLVAGKANSIFSFLFGLGMTIQMQRAEARGGKLTPVYLRRLAVLFLIGAAHGVLLWHGDVLHIYAVIGLLLLAVRRASNKTIFTLIIVMLVASVARSAYALYTQEPPTHSIPYYVALAHEHMHIFRHGSYLEQLGVRLYEYEEGYGLIRRLQGWIWTFPSFSITMLLGFYAGRERLLENVQANADRIRRILWWCLGLGIAVAVTFATLRAIRPPPTARPTVLGFFIGLCFNVHRPLLCIAYIAGIALLFQAGRAQRFFMQFAITGRMPLTNYIMQSAIATTIFYSYGFGLFGHVGPAMGLLVTFAIFAVQIVYSKWWLARFRFGPLEWLWRGATYGKFPPLRIAESREPAVAQT
jgi:uncharacterized protein